MSTPTQTAKPEASATTQAAKPTACPAKSSQAGRDAVLIHGLAFVFAAAAVSTNVWLVPRHFEYERAVVVGGLAALILVVWSVLLAVRALLRPGSKRFPAAVLALFGVEVTAVCLLILWAARRGSEFVSLGFLVFIPVFVLASMVGVPVAWWRSKPRAGTPEPKGRWKRGLAWYCAVTALAIVVLLPCPLFLYCSHCEYLYHPDGSWQAWVIEHTPVAVGEVAASVLSCLKSRQAVELYNQTLSTGRVSQARLIAELTSTNGQTQVYAFQGLLRTHREAALEFANKLADGQVRGATPPLLGSAGQALGTYCSAEQIRPFLDAKRAQQTPCQFLEGVLWGAFPDNRHTELLPDLERFCDVDSPGRAVALQVLAWYAPPTEEIKGLWVGFLADRDPLRRAPAIRALSWRAGGDGDMVLEIVLAAFGTRNKGLHLELIEELPIMYFRDPRRELLLRLVKPLLPFLEDEDPRLRRGATFALAMVTNADWSLQNQFEMLRRQALASPVGAEPPDSPAEQELVKKVRDGALKWLQDAEQGKSKK